MPKIQCHGFPQVLHKRLSLSLPLPALILTISSPIFGGDQRKHDCWKRDWQYLLVDGSGIEIKKKGYPPVCCFLSTNLRWTPAGRRKRGEAECFLKEDSRHWTKWDGFDVGRGSDNCEGQESVKEGHRFGFMPPLMISKPLYFWCKTFPKKCDNSRH